MGIKRIALIFVMGVLIAILSAFNIDEVIDQIWKLGDIEEINQLLVGYVQQTDDLERLEELQNVWNYFDSEGCQQHFRDAFFTGTGIAGGEVGKLDRDALLPLIRENLTGYYLYVRFLEDPIRKIEGARLLIETDPEFDRAYRILLFAYLEAYPFEPESVLSANGMHLLREDIPRLRSYYARYPKDDNSNFGMLFISLVEWDIAAIHSALGVAIENDAEWINIAHQYLLNTFGDREGLDGVILNFADLLYARLEQEGRYRDVFFELAELRLQSAANRGDWEQIIAFFDRFPKSGEIEGIAYYQALGFLMLERWEELKEIAVEPDYHHAGINLQKSLREYDQMQVSRFYNWLAETYPDEPQHRLLLVRLEEVTEEAVMRTRELIALYPGYFPAVEHLAGLFVDAFFAAAGNMNELNYFIPADFATMIPDILKVPDIQPLLLAATILSIIHGDQEEALALYARVDGLGYGAQYSEPMERALLNRMEFDLLWQFILVHNQDESIGGLSADRMGEAIDKFCDYIYYGEFWDILIGYLDQNPSWLERESQQYSLVSVYLHRLEYDHAIEVLFYMLETGTIGLHDLEMLAASEPEITIHPQWKLLYKLAESAGDPEEK